MCDLLLSDEKSNTYSVYTDAVTMRSDISKKFWRKTAGETFYSCGK